MDKSVKLSQFNMYANGSLLIFSDGEMWLERDEINYDYSKGDKIHKVVEGETLTRIAWKYYRGLVGNSQFYWYLIADVNDIENPMDLSDYVGKNIIIPDLLKIKLIDLQN